MDPLLAHMMKTLCHMAMVLQHATFYHVSFESLPAVTELLRCPELTPSDLKNSFVET